MSKKSEIGKIKRGAVNYKTGVIPYETVDWECDATKAAALVKAVMPRFGRSVTGGSYELTVSERHPGKLLLVHASTKCPPAATMTHHAELFEGFFERYKGVASRHLRQISHELTQRAAQITEASRAEVLGIYRGQG